MKTQERDVDEGTLFQFEKGYLWETVLSMALSTHVGTRIGEIKLDGIAMSPDCVDFGEGPESATVLEEYKCTAVSSSMSPADNWKWMMQVKGYCKALGATKCVFRILHHMDIMYKPDECYKVWELVFTQAELDENWQAVLNHARVMRERGSNGIV